MTKIANLVFITNGDHLLLIYKKRGFGAHKWNGPGGKVTNGETIKESAIREVKEEVGLFTSDLEEKGILNFYFGHKSYPDWKVHIFTTSNFTGKIFESEEAKPQWFQKENIPYDKMWEDDKYWLPKVLDGKSVEGDFYFSEDMEKLLSYELNTK